MANTFNNPNSYGAYAPTTNIWDVSELYSVDVTSPEFKELLVRLYQNVNLIATVLNLKDTGYYDTKQFVCGQQFFPNPGLSSTSSTMPTVRPVYRKTFLIPALRNASTLSVPHGITITKATSFTRIYGVANDQTGFHYLPLPYSSCTSVADNIELNLDVTNINIITGSNRTNFTTNYVIVEFLQT